jgi:threonine dehydrogenase-like Zn-dependent dehydrogenase
MRALVKTQPARGLELLEVPDPVPGPGEILVRVGAAGVCGSDVARYVWTRNYEAGGAKAMTRDLPRIIGHEFAGTVEALGDGASGVSVGARVVVQNILGCWRCDECLRGMPNLCVDRRTLGVHRDGGYAELVVAPMRNLTPMPDSMSMHLGAALQPFAVGTHAVAQADLRPGDRIVVWGLGPIGLAVVHAARLRGATVALGFDRNRVRLAEAESLGIPTMDTTGLDDAASLGAAILDRVGPRSLDAAFEAAGVADAISAVQPALRKQRPIVLIGNLKDVFSGDLMPHIMDEQRLVGSRTYSMASWAIAARTIEASGFERTLGEEVGLDDAIDRFEAAARGEGRPFTILPNGPTH